MTTHTVQRPPMGTGAPIHYTVRRGPGHHGRQLRHRLLGGSGDPAGRRGWAAATVRRRRLAPRRSRRPRGARATSTCPTTSRRAWTTSSRCRPGSGPTVLPNWTTLRAARQEHGGVLPPAVLDRATATGASRPRCASTTASSTASSFPARRSPAQQVDARRGHPRVFAQRAARPARSTSTACRWRRHAGQHPGGHRRRRGGRHDRQLHRQRQLERPAADREGRRFPDVRLRADGRAGRRAVRHVAQRGAGGCGGCVWDGRGRGVVGGCAGCAGQRHRCRRGRVDGDGSDPAGQRRGHPGGGRVVHLHARPPGSPAPTPSPTPPATGRRRRRRRR